MWLLWMHDAAMHTQYAQYADRQSVAFYSSRRNKMGRINSFFMRKRNETDGTEQSRTTRHNNKNVMTEVAGSDTHTAHTNSYAQWIFRFEFYTWIAYSILFSFVYNFYPFLVLSLFRCENNFLFSSASWRSVIKNDKNQNVMNLEVDGAVGRNRCSFDGCIWVGHSSAEPMDYDEETIQHLPWMYPNFWRNMPSAHSFQQVP